MVEQCSRDLTWLFCDEKIDSAQFSVYCHQDFAFKDQGLKVSLNVIGESHIVICEWLTGFVFSEVLACVPLKDTSVGSRGINLPAGLLDGLVIKKSVNDFIYSFIMTKIKFSDSWYGEEFSELLATGGEKIG